jgi:hypothetical protein
MPSLAEGVRHGIAIAGRHDIVLEERPTSGPGGGRPTGEPTRDYGTGWCPRTRRSRRSASRLWHTFATM